MNNSTDESIYRKLQQHLDNFPIGFPATDSCVEIEILKFLFTPLQAKIASCLNLSPKTPAKVRQRLLDRLGIKMTEQEITDHLHQMFMNGSLERSGKEGSFRYSNAMLAIGMFEYHVDHLTREFVENMNKYFDEAFDEEFFRTSTPQLRTSPHAKALIPEHNIATYDDMRLYVQNVNKPIQVANCVCKQGEALLGNPGAVPGRRLYRVRRVRAEMPTRHPDHRPAQGSRRVVWGRGIRIGLGVTRHRVRGVRIPPVDY